MNYFKGVQCNGSCEEIPDLRQPVDVVPLDPFKTVIGSKEVTVLGVRVGRSGGGRLSEEELVTAKDCVLQHILAVSDGRKLNTPEKVCSHFRERSGPVVFSSGVPALLAELHRITILD